MIESRTPSAYWILAALATVVLTACGEGTDLPQGSQQTELRQTVRKLEQSQAALATAERRIATMREEQTRDRQRLAELSAGATRLQRRNQELGQHLARARAQLAQQAKAEKALRQQRDQIGRRLRELANERQSLHAGLARANAEVRRLQSRKSPEQRRIADLRYRGAAAAREVEELRRYNGFLLQERGNLQAWLEESNAARRKQQEALRQAEQEVTRVTSAQSAAEVVTKKLQTDLDTASRELATVKTSRAALENEFASLRVTAARLAEAERSRSEQLEKALAHASTLAEAHDSMAAQIETRAEAQADVATLRAQLDEVKDKLSRMKIAKDYLVEQIEACSAERQSSSVDSARFALLDAMVRERIESLSSERTRGCITQGRWQSARSPATLGPARPIKVAATGEGQPKSNRHEKVLKETRERLAALEREHEALTKKLDEVQSECAAVQEQVQTLTWANKELVKELDTAYASREAGIQSPLPKGTRGVYVLRQGESLSRVANAFYGEPDRWKDIVAANKEKIPDPDMVKAGTIILIPE